MTKLRLMMLSRRYTWLTALMVLGAMLALTRVSADQQFEARTTLMEVQHPGSSAKIDERHMGDLAMLAASEGVKQRTVDTLYRIGITSHPEEIVTSLTATPKPGTNVLVIRVVAPDPQEAEAVASVAAAEFIKTHDEMALGLAMDYKEKTGKKSPPSPVMQIVDQAQSSPVLPPPVISAPLLIGLVSFVFGVTVGIVLSSFRGPRRHD